MCDLAAAERCALAHRLNCLLQVVAALVLLILVLMLSLLLLKLLLKLLLLVEQHVLRAVLAHALQSKVAIVI